MTTKVQSNSAAFSGVTSVNVAFGSGGTNGSLYVASVTAEGPSGGSISSISDNRNAGGYTADITQTNGGIARIASKTNTSTSVATVTASFGAACYGILAVFEITSAGGTPTLDVTDGFITSGRNLSLTTASANDFVSVISGHFPWGGGSADSGFTTYGPNSGYNWYHGGEHGILSTSGGHSLTYTAGVAAGVTAGAAYKDAVGGGTAYTKSVVGSITFSSNLTRKTATKRAGSVTPSGTAVRRTKAKRSGSITATGAIAHAARFHLALIGAVTAAGALRKKTARSLAGSVTIFAYIAKKTQRRLTAMITPVSVLRSSFTLKQAMAGAITAAGSLGTQYYAFIIGEVTRHLTHLMRYIGRR